MVLTEFKTVCFWHSSPLWARASPLTRILDQTQRRTTVGRTPLDEWSARRRDLYLTTHTTLTTENINASGGIRTHNLSRRAAADLRLRLRGHWDRQWNLKWTILNQQRRVLQIIHKCKTKCVFSVELITCLRKNLQWFLATVLY